MLRQTDPAQKEKDGKDEGVNYSFWFALFFALLCPLLNCPLLFALVMPLYMPSTDNLKCPLYILPFLMECPP